MRRPLDPHATLALWTERLFAKVSDHLVGRHWRELKGGCLAALRLLGGNETLVIGNETAHRASELEALRCGQR